MENTSVISYFCDYIPNENDMELIQACTHTPEYDEAERLMQSAFPPEERRPTAQQRDYTDHNPRFHACLIMENKRFLGLLNYWTLDGFAYIEHLATLPELRGKGIGQQALQLFTNRIERPVILEVEPPTDGLTARRIAFYQRCGFKLWEHNSYIQPPYSPDLPSVPLLLMAYGPADETSDFEHILHELHTCVYGVEE